MGWLVVLACRRSRQYFFDPRADPVCSQKIYVPLEERKQLSLFFSNVALEQISDIENEFSQVDRTFQIRDSGPDFLVLAQQLIEERLGLLPGDPSERRKQRFFLGAKMIHEIHRKVFSQFLLPLRQTGGPHGL